MPKAVLDTNVLASGLASFLIEESIPGQLLHAFLDDWFELIYSEYLLTEPRRTLTKSYFARRLNQDQISRVLAAMADEAAITPITVTVSGVATHPEDDLILATAVSGHADYLVTGDRQLLQLGSYQGVRILSPRAFLELLEDQ